MPTYFCVFDPVSLLIGSSQVAHSAGHNSLIGHLPGVPFSVKRARRGTISEGTAELRSTRRPGSRVDGGLPAVEP